MAIKVYCPKCKKEVWSGIDINGNAYHTLPIEEIDGEWWGKQIGLHNPIHKVKLPETTRFMTRFMR